MKHLLYYSASSEFIADQVACGGDGSSVVSVVDGVAWVKNDENVFYRFSGKDEDIVQYTVTVHYKLDSGGTYSSLTEDEIVTVNVYSGKSSEVYLQAKQFEPYGPTKLFETITVSANTEYTFLYTSEKELKSITMSKGAYLLTDVFIAQTDRFIFKFKSSDCNMHYFGAQISSTNNRLFFYGNIYDEFVLSTCSNGSSINPLISHNGYYSANTIFEMDFNLKSRSASDFKINNSTDWIRSANLSYLPNYDLQRAMCINARNDNGNCVPGGSNSGVTVTVYEFRVIDENGVNKAHIVPILKNGTPKFKNLVSGNILDIEIASGYNPIITYEE